MSCASFTAFALLRCLAADPSCMPAEAPPVRYLVPLVRKESRGNPNAVRDETTGESVFPATRAEAKAEIERRLARGHRKLGIGWGQGTHFDNWRWYGWLRPDGTLDVDKATEPCEQLRSLAMHFETSILAAAGADYNGGIKGRMGLIPAATHYGRDLRDQILAQPRTPPPPEAASAPTCAAPEWDAWARAGCNSAPSRPRKAATPELP